MPEPVASQPHHVDPHALSREELIELLEATHEGGIRIDFVGKTTARKIARKVRPRTLQPRRWCLLNPAEPTLTDDISDPGTGYLIASNETWELTQVIPMEYNRFVLYSSNIFHSPLYDERDFGSTLEARRLTQNFYFVKRSVGQ